MTTKQHKSMKEHMEKMLSVIGATVASWKAENSEEKLARKVQIQLDERQEEIVFKLLGFNESWGKWEVDNCNGRSGNSAAGDYLRKAQQDAIEKWLEAVTLPPMPPSAVKALKAEYLRSLEYRVKESLQRIAHQKADEIATTMIEQCISDEGAAQNYFKLLALLEQTNTKQT